MKRRKNNWQSVAVTGGFVGAIAIALAVLAVALIIFAGNQSRFSEQLNEALLAAGGSEGFERRVEAIKQLHELQKSSSATDIFAFIYAFLSSVFVALGAYYVNTSKKNVETLQKDYKEMESRYLSMEDKVAAMQKTSDRIQQSLRRFEEASAGAGAVAKLQKTTTRAMQLLNMLISIAVCTDSDLLDSLVYEFLPRINEHAAHIPAEIAALVPEDYRHGDVGTLKSVLNEVASCAKMCEARTHVLLDGKYLRELQAFAARCNAQMDEKTNGGH